MKHIGLFEGIGGFSLAARWAGWETVAWCEWNEFGQRVLRHHFPEVKGYGDITQTNFTQYADTIDIVTGGFPCQPYSLAGKRKGKDDNRHLWPEMLRAIREIRPRWVVGENVLGLVNWNGGLVFHEVQTDLEAAGYEVWPYVLPACAVNAPHRRDRVWFVAYRNDEKCYRGSGSSERTWQEAEHRGNGVFSTASRFGKIRSTAHPNGERFGQEHKFCTGRDMFESSTEKTRHTPHPNGNGLNQRNGNDEEQPSEGGFNALINAYTGNEYEDVADTESRGNGRIRNESEEARSSEGNHPLGGVCRISSAADTCNERLQRSKVNGSIGGSRKESDKLTTGCVRSTWQNFPTQSPVCGGDDGLPTRLDGITFPKWRNESIKAYGNAIVPQVAYELFKVINQMNLAKDAMR
jgi:DNA (cytosine-5)-methyltransferase 1